MNRHHSLTFHPLQHFIKLSVFTILSVVFFCSSASAAGLYVTLDGTGGGFVTSDPPGISCPIASCSADFPDGSPVSLIPTPNSTSTFSGWSNACTNATGNCSVTMNSATTASAHFTAAPKARIVATGTGYPTLGAAYSAANSGDTIMALDSVMPDTSLNIDAAMAQGKSVTIKGGYTADYSSRSLLPTSVHGPLSLGSGSLEVDGLAIIPNDNVGTVAITATSGAHGTVTPTGVSTLSLGASKTYTITPNTGYTIAALTVDGSSITQATSYTFSNVQADHSISATFSIIHTGGSTTIADVAEACAAEPVRGTVYYYCDCGTGADASCVAGNDANAGTDPVAPRRTIANATARFRSLTGTNTVALCKGGAFNATGGLSLNNSSCAAGTTCNDLREYSPPTFMSSAKPIINNAAGSVTLFSVTGVNGGIRILNLKLVGDNSTLGNANRGIFTYRGAHDVTMCNLDMDAFDLPVYNESGGDGDAATTSIKLTGSSITNSRTIGYLGTGHNSDISYNYWDGNGGSNMFDHTIYLGSSKTISNMQVIGNYIHGQYGSTCLGAVMIAHAAIDGLLVKDNIIMVEASQATPGCWGLGFNNNTNATHPQFYRNAVFSGNTIINGGNLGLTVSSCPGCVIENNIIINNWPSGGATGISVPAYGQNVTRGDDVNSANSIRNNTVWFGPGSTGTSTGIDTNVEGTGYIVSNNTVSSSQTTGTLNCFRHRLPLTSYRFINNNHCYSTVPNKWEYTQGSLAQWQAYSATAGFDTVSITGINPLFIAAGSDFTPVAGSPLLAAGTALYGSLLDKNGKTRTNPPAIGAVEGNTISLSLVPARTTGVAPLSVFFDASATTDNGVTTRPFHDLEYTWSFGDANAGTWAYGAKAGGSKNTATGPVASHVFETPGTYHVTLTAFDGTNSATASTTITVLDPDAVFAGSNTICFSTSATYTDCPAGATHVQTTDFAAAINDHNDTNRRLLFRRGETFTAASSGIISKMGPGIIGAYGPDSLLPIAKITTDNPVGGKYPILQISDRDTPGIGDWRVMDFEIDGSSVLSSDITGIGSMGGFNQLLVLRVNMHDIWRGVGAGLDILNYWDNNGSPGHTIFDQWAVVDSYITALPGCNSPGNYNCDWRIYLAGKRSTVQGNFLDNQDTGGSHVLRSEHTNKGVFSNNTLARAGDFQMAIKLHSTIWGYAGVSDPTGAGVYTQQVVIADNKIIGGINPWTISLGPQDEISDERLRDIIVERNWFTAGSASQLHMHINSSETTIRNNICDLTGAAWHTCVSVDRWGIALAPANVHLFNNTLYSGTSGDFIGVEIGTATDTIVRNNLASAPLASDPVMIDGTGTGLVQSNNLLNNTPAALFIKTSPVYPTDFILKALPNPARDAVTQNSNVFSDFFRTLRPQGSASDLGAVEGM